MPKLENKLGYIRIRFMLSKYRRARRSHQSDTLCRSSFRRSPATVGDDGRSNSANSSVKKNPESTTNNGKSVLVLDGLEGDLKIRRFITQFSENFEVDFQF